MLISTEASILRNGPFFIITNPRARGRLEEKIKKGGKIRNERNNKKRKKENEKSNRKMRPLCTCRKCKILLLVVTINLSNNGKGKF